MNLRNLTGQRRSGCFGGVAGAFVGVLLFLASFGLLFWNEGRAVQTYNSLQEGAAAVQEVDPGNIDPANDDSLVYVAGIATTDATLFDAEFNVTVNAIRLVRTVEMYQWQETSQSEDDGSASYDYKKVWSEKRIESNSFAEPQGHENPNSMPYLSQTQQAATVTLGEFRLSDTLIGKMGDGERLNYNDDHLPAELRNNVLIIDGAIYGGTGTPGQPQIGDIQITFTVLEPQPVSVVAQQSGDLLGPYQTRSGDKVELLTLGVKPSSEMFESAQTGNSILTWFLRGGGLMAMFGGLVLALGPMAGILRMVPLLGVVLEKAMLLVAFAISFLLSLIAVAVSWIVHRPLLGVALLCLGELVFVVAMTGAVLLARFSQKQAQSAAPNV